MFKGKPRAAGPGAVLLLFTIGMPVSRGQSVPDPTAPQPPQATAKPAGVLQIETVKTGLYVITGGGGNSVLRLSGNGLIVVDGKLADNYDELRRKIRRIAEQPVRTVVNTSHYEAHTGTNAKFLAGGAQVVAQENVTKNLAQFFGQRVAPPMFTYDREQKLQYGLVEVDLLHFGNARTSGDTVVYFPDLKAVAMGDLYSADPEPDFSAGGSFVGWSHVLAEILKLDFTVAIPGDGPTVSRADVEALKLKIDGVIARGSELVKSGVPKDELMTRLHDRNTGWEPDFSGERLDHFYAELAQSR
jgi:cyclase